MSEIVVYGVPGSPFVRAVEVGLKEKGATYRFQPMAPQESKSEAYLRRHPFGRVPAFGHGEFSLYETQAILRYLDDVFSEPRWTPADPQAAARMNQIIGINDWYFFPKATAPIVFQRIVGPVLLGSQRMRLLLRPAFRWRARALPNSTGCSAISASSQAISSASPTSCWRRRSISSPIRRKGRRSSRVRGLPHGLSA